MYLANTDLYYCHPELDAHAQAPRIYYIFYIKLAYYQESAIQIHKRLKLPFSMELMTLSNDNFKRTKSSFYHKKLMKGKKKHKPCSSS